MCNICTKHHWGSKNGDKNFNRMKKENLFIWKDFFKVKLFVWCWWGRTYKRLCWGFSCGIMNVLYAILMIIHCSRLLLCMYFAFNNQHHLMDPYCVFVMQFVTVSKTKREKKSYLKKRSCWWGCTFSYFVLLLVLRCFCLS